MTRVDRVLEILDNGLQSSPERGYPEFQESDGCTRCHAPRADESDFCAPCRAFLLGDTEDDPTTAWEQCGPLTGQRMIVPRQSVYENCSTCMGVTNQLSQPCPECGAEAVTAESLVLTRASDELIVILTGGIQSRAIDTYHRMMAECANLLTELSFTSGIPVETLEATADAIALARSITIFEAVHDLNRTVRVTQAANETLQEIAIQLGAWFTEFAQHPVWEQLKQAIATQEEITATAYARFQPYTGTNPFVRMCPSHGTALRGGACVLCQRRTRRLR